MIATPFTLSEAERRLVIEAYRAGIEARRAIADCYLAAIDMMHRRYPEATREAVARQVVAVIMGDVRLVELARR
jgi:hypothetical protein